MKTKTKKMSLALFSTALVAAFGFGFTSLTSASANTTELTLDSFVTKNGAYLNVEHSGLRFVASISQEDYAKVGEGAQFGMAIARVDSLEDLKTLAAGENTSAKVHKPMAEGVWVENHAPADGNEIEYSFVTTGIAPENYAKNYTVCAYVEVDGQKYYSTVADNTATTRSPLIVAINYAAAYGANDFVNTIISTVKPELTFEQASYTLEQTTEVAPVVKVGNVPVDVTLTSSEPSVVAVENGKLVAKGKGTATITASIDGVSADDYTQATVSVEVVEKDIKDDFTPTGVKLSDSNVFEHHNVTNTTANGKIDYANCLLPSTDSMQQHMAPADGYITYKFAADSGMVLDTLTLNLSCFYGHGGGLYWWNSGRFDNVNTLGANLYVEVSEDNATWTKVYDLNTANNNAISTTEKATFEPTIDLTESVQGKAVVYVRIYMMHKTAAEINSAAITSGDGILFNRFGVGIYSVDFDTTYTEIPTSKQIAVSDDFTPTGVTLANSHVYEANNATNTDANGNINYAECLLPSTVPMQTTMLPDDGYITYKFAADGMALNTLTLNLSCFYGHASGLYWWNSSRFDNVNTLGANLYVEVSEDNATWTKVYDLNTANNDAISKAAKETYEPTIDLTESVQGKAVVYVRIYMMHMTVAETKNDDVANGVSFNKQFGVGIYSVDFEGEYTLVA